MIVIAGMILGAILGWRKARKLGGNRMDIAQYAGVGAIAGASFWGCSLRLGLKRCFNPMFLPFRFSHCAPIRCRSARANIWAFWKRFWQGWQPTTLTDSTIWPAPPW